MSQSRALQAHIAQMAEIRSILNSMKNLALIEIHKLSRFQSMQGQAVSSIEAVAEDFLRFFPGLPQYKGKQTAVAILLGAERGFCGDFNDRLLKAIDNSYTTIIAIGSRLHSRLPDQSKHEIEKLKGANVAEEVPMVLNRLIEILDNLQKTKYGLTVAVFYHAYGVNDLISRQIIPPFQANNKTQNSYGVEPILNLPPAEFLSDLINHYLFALLHEIFYISLIAENHRRLQHLESAVKHLDDDVLATRRKAQIFRQEEITEEIEVILLNADSLSVK